MEQAVIDRFEGAFAVLIVGEERRIMDVPRMVLPRGAKEGQYLQLNIEDGEIMEAVIDDAATEAAKQRIAEKLARLRRGDHLKEPDR